MHSWSGKISNHKQLGGIETSVLDNGVGRGVRIAWIDTGTGFRYKIVLDRAMDIAEAFYNEHSLAWISHKGVTGPQPMSLHGADWLRNFGGGLLATCGLDHVGGPEQDAYGTRGVHGEISNIAAEIIAIKQPNIAAGDMTMSITGIIRQHTIFGPCLTLKRTLSGTVGEANLQLHDEIINEGNQSVPFMILYHFNFGWPLVDEGTEIIWKGKYKVATDPAITIHHAIKKCPQPLDLHLGSGESLIFIEPESINGEEILCGLWNAKKAFGVQISFNKSELPCLTNWQHFATNEYVTGIEPGTHLPIGQKAARASNTLLFLKPGEIKNIHLQLRVIGGSNSITHDDQVFLNLNKEV